MNQIESKQLFDILKITIQLTSLSVLALIFLRQHRYTPPEGVVPLDEAEKSAKKNLTLILTAATTIMVVNFLSYFLEPYGGLLFFATTIIWIIALKMFVIKKTEA